MDASLNPAAPGAGAKFIYYGIQNNTGRRITTFIRVANESIDAEWRAMLQEPGRTFPFFVFSTVTQSHGNSMRAVALERLRRVGTRRAVALEQAWNEALTAPPGAATRFGP